MGIEQLLAWFAGYFGKKATDASLEITTSRGRGMLARWMNKYPRPSDQNIEIVKGCSVYQNVNPQQYSEYVTAVVKSQCGSGKLRSIRTTCTFEPSFFYEKVITEMRQEHNDLVDQFEGCYDHAELSWTSDRKIQEEFEKIFKRIAHTKFPHFAAFTTLGGEAERVRILILSEEETTDFIERNPYYVMKAFELFLNNGTTCYVINSKSLIERGISMITDYCVVNDDFLMDYYEESKFLIVLGRRKYVKNAHYFQIFRRFSDAPAFTEELKDFIQRNYRISKVITTRES